MYSASGRARGKLVLLVDPVFAAIVIGTAEPARTETPIVATVV